MPVSNFSVDQHTASDMCVDPLTKICSVTGEAGTGKTMVLGDAVTRLKEEGHIVALCAPTGRAAARIREATGHAALTCHRLLGYGPPDPNDPDDFTIPARSKFSPIPAEFIFVDEASMMSEDLYRSLIDAMAKGACIRFFGDIRQLPPINSEDPPFRRLLEKFPRVVLTKNYRSTDGIIEAAQTINRGSVPRANSKVKILNVGEQVGLTILDKFIDESMFDAKSCQIIAPTRIGKLGTNAINGYVQQKINGTGPVLDIEWGEDSREGPVHIRLRAGDKILWNKNDYNYGLYNGMIGRVVNFEPHDGSVLVEFEGRDFIIPSYAVKFDMAGKSEVEYDPRRQIELAYAITVHKSQGSEFERVIILLYWSQVLSRQAFYTAMTRGREHVTVIAARGGLKAALKNDPVMEPRK